MWKPKANIVGLMARLSPRTSSRVDWYFDNGCCKHMTGFRKTLDSEKVYSNSHVTFCNGEKGKILGSSNLIDNDLPNMNNVLLVKRLTFNLISISQLCDQGMTVRFSKFECIMTDEKDEVLMKGIKTKNNCYTWVPQSENLTDGSTVMFPTMLKHLVIPKRIDFSHPNKTNRENCASKSREKLTSDTYVRILSTKHLKSSKGKIDFFTNEKLELSLKVRCTRTVLAFLFPLVHADSGNHFQIITQRLTGSNHIIIDHNQYLFLSELLIIIHISVIKYQHPPSVTKHHQQLHINMRFKTDTPGSKEGNGIEPISTVSPIKSKKRIHIKSTLKK